jgi:hypothetical protein
MAISTFPSFGMELVNLSFQFYRVFCVPKHGRDDLAVAQRKLEFLEENAKCRVHEQSPINHLVPGKV